MVGGFEQPLRAANPAAATADVMRATLWRISLASAASVVFWL
jgi:hypothetical protein